jgi:hypothetical protein
VSEHDDPEFFDKIRNQADEPTSKARANGPAQHQFHLVRFNDIRLDSSRPYLVRGLIPREGLTVIWGPPKCGKTFWAFDLALHIALGWPYRGRRVAQGIVVYVACEGERGLRARKEAFRRTNLGADAADDPPFFLLSTRLDLAKQVDDLIMDIAAQIPPGPVGAIFLDTLNRSIGGSESKDEDMGAYVTAAAVLAAQFQCAIIIIHHCGTNENRPRGHTSLTGAVEAQIGVKRDAAERIIAVVEYMKDGPEEEQVVSKLEVVDVGTDEDGESITSCVIAPPDDEEIASAKKAATLPPAAKIALAQLNDAVAVAGETPPASNHIPQHVRVVSYDLWRRYCYAGQIAPADTDAAREKAFQRAAKGLLAGGYAAKWENWVWPA